MKRDIARAFFTVGQQLLLKRMFKEMYIQRAPFKLPAVILVNHSSFYDGLVVFECIRRGIFPKNTTAVISAAGQQSMPLFQHIGTVRVSQPMKLSEYKNILQVMADDTLVIFPQGEERHLEQRPLGLQPGIEGMLKKYPQHNVICLSIQYALRGHIRAEFACRMDVLSAERRPKKWSLQDIEAWMTSCVDQLKADIVNARMERYERL